jgi:hypothetical protein
VLAAAVSVDMASAVDAAEICVDKRGFGDGQSLDRSSRKVLGGICGKEPHTAQCRSSQPAIPEHLRRHMCGRHTGQRSALEDRLSGLPYLGGNGYVPLQQVEESSVTRYQQLISQEAVSTGREPGPERTETGRSRRRKSGGELPRRRQERAQEGRVIRIAAEEAQAHSVDQEHTCATGWVEPESIRFSGKGNGGQDGWKQLRERGPAVLRDQPRWLLPVDLRRI